jgi:hypothetical protein
MFRWLSKIFFERRTSRLLENVQRLDCQNREIRHDLKNIAARADALRELFLRMREDDVWRREQDVQQR